MTGVSKNTVVKLLEDVGSACAIYQDKVFRNLTCKRIECDEIWSFVHAKEGHLPPERARVKSCGNSLSASSLV
jgi:dephospho-CoA kinase